MRTKLTPKQTEVYQFMRVHLEQFQRLPTIREIGERFGIASPNGCQAHLLALEKHGWIVRTVKGKYGAWRLEGVKVQLVDEASPPG